MDEQERFKEWQPPQIEHGKLTKWNWMVQHPENLKLGKKVDIGAFSYINAQCGVELEDEVQIGSHCSIYSASTVDDKEGKVVIKTNARIGSHCTVMPGVKIGKNSVIGAHSFINKDIPDDVLAYGIPVKIRMQTQIEESLKNKNERLGEDKSEDKIIPLARPFIGEEEIEEVTKVLKSGVLSLGPYLKEFEEKFAQVAGTTYAVGVNSGTSGLHLCVRALGLKEGDEVITSSFSFVASSNCLLYEKVKPIFVDVEEETSNINADLIEKAITPRTKALLIPHVFGQCSDMTKIMVIAKKYDLKVIEDACESLLASHQGRKAGTFGDVAVFAFYANKQMTTGEGGMIVTNNKEIYDYCKSAANQGRGDSRQWLTHDKLGYNYRMDEMSAALGLVQIKKIDLIIKGRQELAKSYLESLSSLKGINLPKVKPENISSWFVFPIRIKEELRDKLVQKLNERGIQCKAYFYPPIHLQPFYKKEFSYTNGMFPITEKLSRETLVLPFYTLMEKWQLDKVKEGIELALKELEQHTDKEKARNEVARGGKMNIFENKIILVTGATGSIGKSLTKKLLEYSPAQIRLLDQDESALFDFQQEMKEHSNLRFFVGNIREKERLKTALENVNFLFHCAALKHVMSCEYNPLDAVKTNVLGVQNIIETALENNVDKVIFTSSDKAANPNNTMGATKLLGERLFTSANFYRGKKRTVFASVRFGNVMGSRGSVIPLFKKQIREGKPITLTDHEMTRFMMTNGEAVRLVIRCAELAVMGETFILKMPAMKIKDVAEIMAEELGEGKKIEIKMIGARPGETLYEKLMTDEEAQQIIELEDLFVLLPKIIQEELRLDFKEYYPTAKAIPESFYISNKAPLMDKEKLRNMLLNGGIIKND